jgi:uncharacterized protein YbjT (DUF2867 family)
MKFTVIGGTGLIGSQVVQKLTAAGHETVPAAPSTGGHRSCHPGRGKFWAAWRAAHRGLGRPAEWSP